MVFQITKNERFFFSSLLVCGTWWLDAATSFKANINQYLLVKSCCEYSLLIHSN